MTAEFTEPHSYLDVGHSKLAYYVSGKGPDVVFVHGWPLYAATFRRIVPTLARHFTCHLIDLPGAGRSRITETTPIDLLSHATTLTRAISKLRLQKFALLAHDSGGAVARLAAADDDRVAGLVLADTEIPGHHPWVIGMYAAMARFPPSIHVTRALMKIPAIRRSGIGFGGCFSDPAYVDGEFGGLFVRPMLGSLSVMRNHMRLMESVDFSQIDALTAVHGRIRARTRLIWGTDDPFFPVALARSMTLEFAGGAELVEIGGARLFSHEDHSEAFAAHALDFLRKCFATSDAERVAAAG